MTSQWDSLSGETIEHYPDDDKTKISFSLVDGGPYDDDLTEDGSLMDSGGPAVKSAVTETAIPTLSTWGLLILTSLLGVFGFKS